MINHNINKIRKVAARGILFLFLGSLVLNVLLYNKELRKFYTQLYAAELDPIGLSYFLHETNQKNSAERIVVFFGDSRAAQWTAPQIDGFHFANRGIGNQTSAQVLLRFEEHIQPLEPDIIVIQVCINDLKTIPLFPKRKREIIEDCKANITEIVQKSIDLNSTVILTTVLPTSGNVPLDRKLVWSNEIYEAISEINKFILNFQQERVIIFDAASILSNSESNVKSEYVFDLLHLNREGYQSLNLELVKILEEIR